MNVLQSKNILNHTLNIIHEDTQLHRQHIDLTVSGIYRLTGAGSLDFGGSEFNSSPSKPVHPKKKKADDKYGWWHLDGGIYKAVFNESLDISEDGMAIISPHSHSEEAGLLISTKFLSSSDDTNQISVNFQVPVAGCNIKENARFAALHILSE